MYRLHTQAIGAPALNDTLDFISMLCTYIPAPQLYLWPSLLCIIVKVGWIIDVVLFRRRARTLYDCESDDPNELSFKKGQILMEG